MTTIQKELKDDLCILRLDHGKPNSISRAVSEDLIAALDEAVESAKAVVILGRPGMFSGGFDLPTMQQGLGPTREMVKAGGRLLMAIYDHPQPVVVGCSGHAIAMGALMVMAGDERIGATGDFKIGLNETAIGMTLPTFGFELARARLSKRHFDRAVVHSTIYDPVTALDAGFLDRLVEPEELEAACLEAATRLSALNPLAFGNNKRLAHAETVEKVLSTLDANLDAMLPG